MKMKVGKDKLVGVVNVAIFFLLISCVFILTSTGNLIVEFILFLTSIPILIIGYKLLRYPNEIPVSLEEVKESLRRCKLNEEFKGESEIIRFLLSCEKSSEEKEKLQKTIKKFHNFIVSNKVSLLLSERGLHIDGVEEEKDKLNALMEELHNIATLLKLRGANFIIIKFPRLPRVMGDIDILVCDSEDIQALDEVLKELDYVLLNDERHEKYKRLYIKVKDDKILKINPHSEIAWEGTIYLDKAKIWRTRKKTQIKNIEIFTPSPEYELAIAAAHIMFECNQVTLYDIIYLSSLLANNELNIGSIASDIKSKGWYPQFLYFLSMLDAMHQELYGKSIPISQLQPYEKFRINRRITFPFRFPRRTLFLFRLQKILSDLRRHGLKEGINSLRGYILEFVKHRCDLRNPILVCFSGIDGSGKSTHAKALKEKLENLGISCEIVWARWRPIITYPFMGIIYVLKRWRRKDYHKSKILRKIWAYLTILDFAYIYLFKIKPHLIRGKIVICDRYIYDHIADLMYDGLYNEKAVKFLLKLIPNPDVSFIFDVPVDIAITRKADTKDVLESWRFEDSVEDYLNKQRRNYFEIAELLRIPIVDATRDFKELQREIYGRIIHTYINRQRREISQSGRWR